MNQKEGMIIVIIEISITKSNLCDYSYAQILVKGNITVSNTADEGAAVNNANTKVIFKNCAPFTDCITEINNTQKMMLKKWSGKAYV